MIPKGGGTEFREIFLVEVLWKVISGTINRQIWSSIQFHDAIHSFCAGRGTGTAILEVKLLQPLIAMREKVLHSIFLDLCKSYDALYIYHCLNILAGYGVVTRTLRILRTYCDHIQMAAKAGGHYGHILKRHRGVTQGIPLSPTVFNVVVDAVILNWVTVVGGTQEGTGQGLGF